MRVLVVALALGVLVGCAAAPTSYRFVDPAYDGTRYDGFMAYAAFTDRAIEAAFEQALCEQLANTGHACTTMLQEAPPTREQDAASRHRASRKSGAQATIVIELADPETESRQLIGGGRPAYEVTVIDNDRQQVAARVFVDSGATDSARVADQANGLARQVVEALDQQSLLYQRPD